MESLSEERIQGEMLGELRRIREVLTEEPAPPPPPPKGFVEEFVQFLNKYGVIGLAIAFIMGGAVSKLVSALVSDIIMPVIGVFIRDGGWREAVLNLGPIPLAVGSFTGALLDFLIIAFVIFIMMRQLGKTGLK